MLNLFYTQVRNKSHIEKFYALGLWESANPEVRKSELDEIAKINADLEEVDKLELPLQVKWEALVRYAMNQGIPTKKDMKKGILGIPDEKYIQSAMSKLEWGKNSNAEIVLLIKREIAGDTLVQTLANIHKKEDQEIKPQVPTFD